MFKNKWIMAAALGLMLTGCSETTVTEPAQNKVKEETKVKSDSTDLLQYSTEMEEYLVEFSGSMQEFSDLNMEASQNPSIMATDEWIMDVSLSLISMEEHIADIRAVTPPEELEVSHDYVLKAMDSFEYAVDNYPDSLGDLELLNSCIEAMEEGGENLDKAKAEVDKITADM